MNSGFGKAKFGKNAEVYSKIFKLEDGKELIVRLLPPMKSLAASGTWAVYHAVHYGYYGVNKKDPSKTSARPFKCIEEKNFKTGMITRSCPECVEIKLKKELLDERTAQFEKRTDMTAEEKKVVLAPLENFVRKHNVDRKWYINVMDLSGAFGFLTISHRLKKQLDDLIQKINNDEGVDPFDLETGVWFNFRRNGKKLSVIDTVEAVYAKEEVGGRRVNVLKMAPLTEQQQAQALSQCSDLSEVIRHVSIDQMNLLVGSSGDPEDVDRILSLGVTGAKSELERSASRRESSASAEREIMSVVEVMRTTPKAETKTVTTPVTTSAVTEVNAAPVEVKSPKPNTIAELPEDKFLELFEG